MRDDLVLAKSVLLGTTMLFVFAAGWTFGEGYWYVFAAPPVVLMWCWRVLDTLEDLAARRDREERARTADMVRRLEEIRLMDLEEPPC